MNWYEILLNAANSVKESIKPLIGSKKAWESIGKGAGGEVTKRLDYKAEKAIIETLKKCEVSCILVSEESGIKKIGKSPKEFLIVDPIDGTLNALKGIDFYCTSLAVSKNQFLSGVYAGLVMNIVNGDVYYGEKNKGACLNKKTIHTSTIKDLEDSIIGVDVCFLKDEFIVKKLLKFLKKANHTRYFGANALELCQIANGLIEAFIDLRKRLRVTDIAAAQLIIKEAGGLVTSLDGKELDSRISLKERISLIATANEHLLRKILKTLEFL
ncbi:MAG: inositol monophosphatase family protein [Candidatus Bathyarchaeia archaeon]